jgi:hypothetical protein
MMREFSELLEVVGKSVETDHSIDAIEAEQIREKWEDLKACVERFVTGCEEGHYCIKPGGSGPGAGKTPPRK